MAEPAAADHGQCTMVENKANSSSSCVVEVENKANSSSSWVVEVEKMLADCRREVQFIYRVPEWLKNTNNIKAYRPQVMALGPFHHHDPNLRPMEEHKYRAVARHLKQSGKPLQAYIDAIGEVAEQLQAAYGKELGEEWCGENRHHFVDLMVRDGCFLLELMNWNSQEYVPDSGDLFFSEHNYMYMKGTIVSDVLTMENQLPLLVLQRLLRVHTGITPNTQTDRDINVRMLEFLGRGAGSYYVKQLPLGLHPLHLYHSSLTYGASDKPTQQESLQIMPSAVEIHEAGIHFRKSETHSLLDVHFQDSVLSMPALIVDDDFEVIFLNLLAFEYLHADTGNDVTAYVFFMDNIIDTANDVSLLKANGIFENYLGSDKVLAKLINDTLSKGAVMGPLSVINIVQRKVKDHCTKPWNKWRANFMHTYLRNPWVFISLVAACILLLATVLQTMYTVVPFYLNR